MSQLVEPENIKEFYPNAQIAICSDSHFDKDPMSEFYYCKGDALEGLTIHDLVLTHEYTESGPFDPADIDSASLDAIFWVPFSTIILLYVISFCVGAVIGRFRTRN